jgi:FAD/FMN-containing dehydrogenase
METQLKAILKTPEKIILDPEKAKAFGGDWTKEYTPSPLGVVFPETTEEVSQILKLCSERNQKVVPSGGRTGLAAGAVARVGELVLSLERMNRILSLDPVGLVIETEAGVPTQKIQMAAKEAGLFFPLDLAAKGSSHIGGNCATNAGGLKFIRYGGMREQVLGLEVVLADGTILDMNSSLRKNNTGYDLKQLFIGSEGTLGVITRTTLRLVGAPKNQGLLLVGVSDFQKLLQILEASHKANLPLTAFEIFSQKAYEFVQSYGGVEKPLDQTYPYYALIEVEYESLNPLGGFFEALFEKNLVEDGTLGDSSRSFEALWALRERITESVGAQCIVRKNDISVPIPRMGDFVADLHRIYQNPRYQAFSLVIFGHLGDGNIHLNHAAPKGTPGFFETIESLEQEIFSCLKTYKGSISAEHGIGLIKKKDLSFSRSPLEIEMMVRLKKTFDPKNILNPGKIFDL